MAEASNRAINRCEWCGAPADTGVERCAGCGGPVRVLEPWVVECGWCGTSNRRDERGSCQSCGGPLPSIPGGHPGPRPPEPSRTLPRGYPARVMLWKNVFVLIGVIFTIPFFWTLLFPAIGIPMWIHGWRRGKRKLAALRDGVATRGTLTRVALDTSTTINNRHPYRLDYRFETAAGTHRGVSEGWDRSHERRVSGEHLWVVHVPGQPELHALWPPIR